MKSKKVLRRYAWLVLLALISVGCKSPRQAQAEEEMVDALFSGCARDSVDADNEGACDALDGIYRGRIEYLGRMAKDTDYNKRYRACVLLQDYFPGQVSSEWLKSRVMAEDEDMVRYRLCVMIGELKHDDLLAFLKSQWMSNEKVPFADGESFSTGVDSYKKGVAYSILLLDEQGGSDWLNDSLSKIIPGDRERRSHYIASAEGDVKSYRLEQESPAQPLLR